MKVKIITDSTCCIPKEALDKENIGYLESILMIDEKPYKDLSGIGYEEFVNGLQFLDPYPKSSLASPQDAYELFEKAIEEGYKDILYVGLSPNVSNQFNSAKIAAKRLRKKDVNIVLYQSGLMGPSQGAMVWHALHLIKKGKTVDEVIQHLDSLKDKIYTVGLSKDFNTLFRTGKVKKGIAITIIASAFNLKPLYEVNLEQGVVGIGGGRGYKGAIKKIIEAILEKTREELTYDLYITDALAANDIKKQLENEVKRVRKIKKVYNWRISPIVVWAVGKGAIMVTLAPSLNG